MCFPTDLSARIPLRKSCHTKTTTAKVLPVKRSSSCKKSVRFCERTVIAYRHASKEDLQKAWNQRSDIANIKNGIRRSMKALQAADGKLHSLDTNEHNFRGLESGICPTIHRLRKMWVKTAKRCVLDEQRTQRASGIVDTYRLGEIARRASKEAVRCATKMGLLDARQSQKAI